MIDRQELLDRATEFARRTSRELGPLLGFGVHGSVFTVENPAGAAPTAVKVHHRDRFYRRERDVYRRLTEVGLSRVRHCTLPKMIRSDDDLLAIEMSVVTPPYLLDFAGAYLDLPPDYPADVLAEWDREKADQFGADWPAVQAVLRQLETHGIYLLDVNPGGVRVRE